VERTTYGSREKIGNDRHFLEFQILVLQMTRLCMCLKYKQKWLYRRPQFPTFMSVSVFSLVILLADSIRSRLLSWFGSPISKKFPKYHPPNVYGYVEIWMYNMFHRHPSISRDDGSAMVSHSMAAPWETSPGRWPGH
jgi:hypothetical protein